jgi:hypothetical protein
MSARWFEIALTSMHGRIVRHVIAHNSMQATRIAINTMPVQDTPFAIICKPGTRPAHLRVVESQSCSA